MKHLLSPLEKILLERNDETLTLAALQSVNFENFSEAFLRQILLKATPEIEKTIFSSGTLSHTLIDILLETDINLLKKWLQYEPLLLTYEQHQKLLDSGDTAFIQSYYSKIRWQCATDDPMQIKIFPENFGYGKSPQKTFMEHGYIVYAGKFWEIKDLLSSSQLDANAKRAVLQKMCCMNIATDKIHLKLKQSAALI